MTPEEAIKLLDAIDGDDSEFAHGGADNILLSLIPKDVADAYIRVDRRCGGFWYA